MESEIRRELTEMVLDRFAPYYILDLFTYDEMCRAWWRYRWQPMALSIYGEPDPRTKMILERPSSDRDREIVRSLVFLFNSFIRIDGELDSSRALWLFFISYTGGEMAIRRSVDSDGKRSFMLVQLTNPSHTGNIQFVRDVCTQQSTDPRGRIVAVFYTTPAPTLTETTPLLGSNS